MFENKYIAKLKPYKLASHKVWELNDDEILKLDWNEATIQPSPRVKETLVEFIKNGHINWYPDTNNTLLLKELSLYCDISVDNIQYFGSSDYLHEYIAKTFIQDNDKVLIVAPTYDNFRSTMESCGGIVDFFYLDKDFTFSNDLFCATLNRFEPKIVYICNPNNPTGTVYNNDLIEGLVARFQNILFIIDEAYWEFTGITCKDLAKKYNNILICRTFSKAFALASFRIGYVISSAGNINLISKIRNPKNITALSQIAAIAALQNKEYMKKYVKEVNDAKLFFDKGLRELGYNVFGIGGNFSLIKFQDKTSKNKFIEFLEMNKIFIRDYGHIPNMENCVRITIGATRQMEKVLNIIRGLRIEK